MQKLRDNQHQIQDLFEANDEEAVVFGQELRLNDCENLIFEEIIRMIMLQQRMKMIGKMTMVMGQCLWKILDLIMKIMET